MSEWGFTKDIILINVTVGSILLLLLLLLLLKYFIQLYITVYLTCWSP